MRFLSAANSGAKGLMSGLAAVLLTLSVTVCAAGGDDADALYWRIDEAGGEAGFLLATIHSEDPRVVDFPQAMLDDLAACALFAMEMVPDLPTLARLTEFMHYPETGTLQEQLGEARYARVMSALSGYQVPEDWKARMKVWAVLMTLSVPPPETGFFMDLSLSLRASGGGLKVEGLESLEEQLAFLEQMPLEFQVRLLDQALDEYARVKEIHDLMVDAYLTGSLGALQTLTNEQMDELDEPVRRYFVDEGIVARNHRMLENLLPLLNQGKVFVAVGALHLPGEEGLVELLRGAGYTLQPLANPFAGTSGNLRTSAESGEPAPSPAP